MADKLPGAPTFYYNSKHRDKCKFCKINVTAIYFLKSDQTKYEWSETRDYPLGKMLVCEECIKGRLLEAGWNGRDFVFV